MKTFRLIGMALLAVVMCANFASCSSDDDEEVPVKNEEGIVTNQRKLSELRILLENGSNYERFVYYFSYDQQGRVKSVNTVKENQYRNPVSVLTDYTWTEGRVVETTEGEFPVAYTYSNGLIQDETNTYRGYGHTFTYTTGKQLSVSSFFYNYDFSDIGDSEYYTWESGKLTKHVRELYGEQERIFTYSGRTCKGYFPISVTESYMILLYAHPEMFGMRNTQLPEQSHYKGPYSESTQEYTYTFDNEGYITSCIITGDNAFPYYDYESDTDHSAQKLTYSFGWE